MANQTITSNINVDAIAGGAWRSGDQLTIDNGAVVTVNTDQKKFWNWIPINNGKLRIENNSTTTAINFRMGRVSGTGTNSITPGSGLGSVEIAGNWIEMGVSDGTSNQVFTTPYRTHVPALWVETAPGSGVYESWADVTPPYGVAPRHEFTGLEGFSSGRRGMVFENVISADPCKIILLTNCSTTINSRVVTVSDTTDLTPGAHVTGSAAIPANSVVETVLSSTQFEINANATATSSTVTCTIHPTLDQQFTGQIKFGDNVSGAIPPNGCKIRIPNIMVSQVCGTQLFGDNAYFRGGEINLTSSGSADIDTCLFSNFYGNFGQAQSVKLKRAGFGHTMYISKCYDVDIDDVVFACFPTYNQWYGTPLRAAYFYFENGNRQGSKISFDYIAGSIKNVYIVSQMLSNGSSEYGAMRINYSKGIVVQNLRVAVPLGAPDATMHALVLGYVSGATVNGIESYGIGPLNLQYSADNVISNITFGATTLSEVASWHSPNNIAPMFLIDPETKAPFVDGQRYYFKFVAATNGLRGKFFDPSYVCETREIALTPHVGAPNSYRLFEVYPTATGTVVFNWTRFDPTHNAPSYEIFRSTDPAVPVRDASTRVFTTTSANTVTATDSTATAGTTYYYVFRKHSAAGVYIDSPIFEVTPIVKTAVTNRLLQAGDPNNASWTKTGCTSVANNDWASGPRSLMGRLVNDAKSVTTTAANATLTQTVSGLTIGVAYTAQLIAFRRPSLVSGVVTKTSPGRLTFGTAFTDITFNDTWQTFSVTFTATATSHPFTLQINNSGDQIIWGVAGVYAGTVVCPTLWTTTAAVNDSSALPTLAGMMTRARFGYTKNAGVYFSNPVRAGYVSGTWHCSSTKGFTPSKQNMLTLPYSRGSGVLRLLNVSSRNRISNVQQSGFGHGINAVGLIDMAYSSSDNVFENMTYQPGALCVSPGGWTPVLYAQLDCNRNVFKNIEVKHFPVTKSSYTPLFTCDNGNAGNVFQNIKADFSDLPNVLNCHDGVVKGVQGGFDTDDDAVATPRWNIGASVEGTPATFVSVYGTHFSEAYHSATTGALNIFFTPSTKAAPPYALTGTAKFNNTGRLYLQTAGDSATYTWPHKIYGVSGFRNVGIKVLTTDLTTSTNDADIPKALYIEFQIDTGGGYGAWQQATPAALSALTVSATDGFYLKLRLTARPFFRYNGETNDFVAGEIVRHVATGSTARVVEYWPYDASTGICVLDTITGTWSGSSSIVRNSDSQARAQMSTFNSVNTLGPVATSYIQGLQIHTNVDRDALYPATAYRMYVSGVPDGAEVRVRQGSHTIDYVPDVVGGTYVLNHSLPGRKVKIQFTLAGYSFEDIEWVLTEADTTLPVTYSPDPSYTPS